MEQSVCLMGDFNAITSQHEKYGGNSDLNNSSRSFRHFLFEMGLIDLGYKGPAFTWTNRQSASDTIFQRLDRVLVTEQWFQIYPHAYVNHIPRIRSDHAPILLRTQDRPVAKRKFRVEAWWFGADGFQEACSAGWQQEQGGSWEDKTNDMKGSIREWAAQMQTPQNRLQHLQREILGQQSFHPSIQNQTLEENLLREYYKTEEELAMYW